MDGTLLIVFRALRSSALRVRLRGAPFETNAAEGTCIRAYEAVTLIERQEKAQPGCGENR
jgi:hypothetical protein